MTQTLNRCLGCGASIAPAASRCKHCGTVVEPISPIVRGDATLVEPAPKPRDLMPTAGKPTTELDSDASSQPLRYRPLNRPPMALLVALDDGSSQVGEVWRIRSGRHIIGRVRGDTVIGHDGDMSAEHAQITRQWRDGAYRWQLADLDSTNGTFLRVGRARLRDGKELVLGGRRYALRTPPAAAEDATAGAPDAGTRHRHHAPNATVHEHLLPRLVELTPQGDGPQFPLPQDSVYVGSDPQQCQVVIRGDRTLDAKHCRVFRDPEGRWFVEDTNSLNGVWVRIRCATLSQRCEFQLGEQRFSFKVV